MRSHPGVCRGLAKSGLWPPARTSKRSQKTQPKLWKQPKNDGRVRSECLISLPWKSYSRSLGCIYCPVSTLQTYLRPVHPQLTTCVFPQIREGRVKNVTCAAAGQMMKVSTTAARTVVSSRKLAQVAAALCVVPVCCEGAWLCMRPLNGMSFMVPNAVSC